MDNQQGKTDAEALKNWFAGFFDGEGTIFVGKGQTKNGWVSYSPRLAVNNTDVAIQSHVEAALKEFDVPYYVQWSEHRRSSKHKPRWMITINGWKRCLRASQAFLEYLHLKRSQCEDMLELCHRRLNDGHPRGNYRAPHDARQMELIKRLRGRHTAYNGTD